MRIYSIEYENKHRRLGVSGLMRVKNAERFLALSIDSVIDALDELIIVYNDCTDSSPKIIKEYAAKYPDKIKEYAYPHKIRGFNLTAEEYDEIINLPFGAPELLCTYYNFGLSKINYTFCMKIDADQYYHTGRLKEIVQDVHANPTKYKRSLFCFHGINVVNRDNKWYVSQGADEPRLGGRVQLMFNGGYDHVLFEATERTYYDKWACNGPFYDRCIGKFVLESFVHPYLYHYDNSNGSNGFWNPQLNRLQDTGVLWLHLAALETKLKEVTDTVPTEELIPFEKFLTLKPNDLDYSHDKRKLYSDYLVNYESGLIYRFSDQLKLFVPMLDDVAKVLDKLKTEKDVA